jgi:membrane fusion protein (multidrug efflux system)
LKHGAFLTTALMSAALLGGCGKDTQTAGGSFQRPPTPVEAAPVTSAPVTDVFTTVGTLEAGESIVVTTETSGIVTAIPFREGGRLAAGDLIARLDDNQLKAEVQRAQALKDQSQATWGRVQSIVDQGAGAPQDLDDAVAALKVAEANLALAETRLAKARITAPFAGLAGKRRVSPGAYLRAGDAITDLAQIDQLRVDFAVPERILASMRVGAEVSVQTTAYPDHLLTGTIDVIEPQLDPLTRTVAVVARVANPGELLRPGMSATVTAILRQRDHALTVPSAAVFVEGGQAFVYVVKPDSLVSRTPVTLGTRLTDVVEITEGLTAGQSVVRAGHQKLYEGAKVAPVSSVAPEAGTEAAGEAR